MRSMLLFLHVLKIFLIAILSMTSGTFRFWNFCMVKPTVVKSRFESRIGNA